MNRISVALSNMPGLLRSIMTNALSAAPDIEIADTVESLDELVVLLGNAAPHLIVAAERDPALARECRALLASRALPRLLLVTQSGQVALLYWLEPRVLRLGQLTPDTLVREIRAAAALETGWPVPDQEK